MTILKLMHTVHMQEGQRKIPFLSCCSCSCSVTSYHLVNLQFKLHYMIAGETHLQLVPLSASVPGHLYWHHSLFLSILLDMYTGTQGHLPHSSRNRCITQCKIPHTFYPKWNTNCCKSRCSKIHNCKWELTMQFPPLLQGLEAHSSWSVSQFLP